MKDFSTERNQIRIRQAAAARTRQREPHFIGGEERASIGGHSPASRHRPYVAAMQLDLWQQDKEDWQALLKITNAGTAPAVRVRVRVNFEETDPTGDDGAKYCDSISPDGISIVTFAIGEALVPVGRNWELQANINYLGHTGREYRSVTTFRVNSLGSANLIAANFD